MVSYDENIKKNFEYLDKIDFESYLEEYCGENVYDLIDTVIDDYDDTELTNNEFLDGCIFKYIDKWKLQSYLNYRYKGTYQVYEPQEIQLYIRRM